MLRESRVTKFVIVLPNKIKCCCSVVLILEISDIHMFCYLYHTNDLKEFAKRIVSMCVCMYLCMCVCMYVCMYVGMYIRVCMYEYMIKCVCIYVCTYLCS